MSKFKKYESSEHVPTQLDELDELQHVVGTLWAMDHLTEREWRIIQRAVGVYRELIVINEDLKK